ncbi:MAG: Glu-tRNA(Gln) amidotransferase subunit GatE [Candidatus Kapaibacterium sp.]
MYDFEFKPFDEMTPEDYERVGFKSGLEIHQQLLTEKKLFCRCPAGHYSDEYHAEILRHMRPTLSELGEYDGTALMEFKTKKDIIYRINRNTVCTYEMDDTPPFEINDQALDIAIELGFLLNAKVVDEMHIARKQYLDGSIPTGFQRTAIISVGGEVPYKGRNIGIIQMSLEEDSCREESDWGHRRVYIADRLGMPLVETVTQPDMRTPQEVAEVNETLRRLSRSTGKVRTGIGAGREDVNVSVTGGTRIEIKGVPRIKYIPLLTYHEAMRQWNLLRLREELKGRGVNEETFRADYQDVTKILKKTKFKPIHEAIIKGYVVKAVKLDGFKGLLNWQTQTDTNFSKEISDRVRVIACLSELPNIIHSDSQGENIASSEWRKIKQAMETTGKDTIVLVWGSDADTEMGANEIIIRAREATIGIPSETRQALRDGTTGFERILPGPERMYPDTDLPPKKITAERVEHIRSQMPEQIWNREGRYRKLGVPEHHIPDLVISPFAEVFEKWVEENELSPVLASTVIIQYPKRLKKQGLKINIITPDMIDGIFAAYRDGKIPADGILYILEQAIRQEKFDESLIPPKASDAELSQTVEASERQIEKIKLHNPESKGKLLMGFVMDSLRGRISGQKAKGFIEENKNLEVY